MYDKNILKMHLKRCQGLKKSKDIFYRNDKLKNWKKVIKTFFEYRKL